MSKRTKQYMYEFNSGNTKAKSPSLLLGHVVHYLPGDIHCAATIIVRFLSSTHLCDSLEHQLRLHHVKDIDDEADQIQELEVDSLPTTLTFIFSWP